MYSGLTGYGSIKESKVPKGYSKCYRCGNLFLKTRQIINWGLCSSCEKLEKQKSQITNIDLENKNKFELIKGLNKEIYDNVNSLSSKKN